jgi:hypothetical protein
VVVGGGGWWWVVSGRAEWLRECKARKDSASRASQEQLERVVGVLLAS